MPHLFHHPCMPPMEMRYQRLPCLQMPWGVPQSRRGPEERWHSLRMCSLFPVNSAGLGEGQCVSLPAAHPFPSPHSTLCESLCTSRETWASEQVWYHRVGCIAPPPPLSGIQETHCMEILVGAGSLSIAKPTTRLSWQTFPPPDALHQVPLEKQVIQPLGSIELNSELLVFSCKTH